MGLLSFLFKKKYPSKKAFPVLCFTLSRNLESIRKNWIQGCKNILETRTGRNFSDVLTDRGPVDELSKGFQVLIVSEFIAAGSYVHPLETKAFRDLLCAEVFRDELLPCLECVHMVEKHSQPAERHFQVAKGLAGCFMGNGACEPEIPAIQSTVAIFEILSQMAVADVFGDNKTLKQKEIAALNQVKAQGIESAVDYDLLKREA